MQIELQPSLFVTPLLPGLSIREEIITPGEERSLIDTFEHLPLAPFKFQGWLGRRETTSFGWRYDFDGGKFKETTPLPSFLLELRQAVGEFSGIDPTDLVQALVTRYDIGAGIGWHRDRPEFEHVVGISFESPATMRLRQRTPTGFRRSSLHMPPRSVYHLSGEVRHGWEHSILEVPTRRWSVTFRSLSARGIDLTTSTSKIAKAR